MAQVNLCASVKPVPANVVGRTLTISTLESTTTTKIVGLPYDSPDRTKLPHEAFAIKLELFWPTSCLSFSFYREILRP